MRMAAVGSVIPNYMAAPQGVGYAGQPVESTFQTFSDRPQAHPEEWGPVSGYF